MARVGAEEVDLGIARGVRQVGAGPAVLHTLRIRRLFIACSKALEDIKAATKQINEDQRRSEDMTKLIYIQATTRTFTQAHTRYMLRRAEQNFGRMPSTATQRPKTKTFSFCLEYFVCMHSTCRGR